MLAWLLFGATACSGDPRSTQERAEPPVEAVAPARPPSSWRDADALAISGTMEFAGDVRIDNIEVSPAVGSPGGELRVSGRVSGLAAGARVHVGLRTPASASRQVVFPGGVAPRPLAADHRDRLFEVTPVGEGGEATFDVIVDVPAPWHPRTCVITLELEGRRALRGPRLDDGAAVLAVVPVDTRPTAVVAARVQSPISVDGQLREDAWAGPGAVLSESRDGEPVPGPAGLPDVGGPTRVWFAWDDEALYVAGDVPDDDLFSEFSEQDDPLYKAEAFELFVAGDNRGARYLEYQVSVRGVTFDARFPRYRRGDEAWDSTWSVAVDPRGTINNPRDRDEGWSLELQIPWSELCAETEIECPPRAGQQLRVNVFRLEMPDRRGQVGLSLSPTRAPDFHAWSNAAVLELGAGGSA